MSRAEEIGRATRRRYASPVAVTSPTMKRVVFFFGGRGRYPVGPALTSLKQTVSQSSVKRARLIVAIDPSRRPNGPPNHNSTLVSCLSGLQLLLLLLLLLFLLLVQPSVVFLCLPSSPQAMMMTNSMLVLPLVPPNPSSVPA